jgi:hypothetical protein
MVFPSAKIYINGHNKRPNGGPLVSPPITNHNPYKHTTIGQTIVPTKKITNKFQHHMHQTKTTLPLPPSIWSIRLSNVYVFSAIYFSKRTKSMHHRPKIHGPQMDHPTLLVMQKITVDEDAILPYFPNIVESVPG